MIFVDTAVPEDINRALTFPGVIGFTTNPALVVRAVKQDALTIQEYRKKAGALCDLAKTNRKVVEFMIQGIGEHAQICEQAETYLRLLGSIENKKLWMKLLPTADCLKLIPDLQELGCKTLVTGVFTAQQALIAMEADADGIAVYLGRMMRLDTAWQKSMDAIARVMQHCIDRLFLIASLDKETVDRALCYSIDLTLPPAILWEMLESTHSAAAINDFNQKIIL